MTDENGKEKIGRRKAVEGMEKRGGRAGGGLKKIMIMMMMMMVMMMVMVMVMKEGCSERP
jgi:ABC-type Na+ efflux pump permease subunit